MGTEAPGAKTMLFKVRVAGARRAVMLVRLAEGYTLRGSGI